MYEPKIIGFLCNWCSYAAADLAGTSRIQYPPNMRVIRVMCSSRVGPEDILNTLTNGIDGVLVAGCHPGDCHYRTGNLYTRRRVMMLKKLLETIGIAPGRLRLEWVSASEGNKFAEVVNDFVEELKEIGPNSMKEAKK
jgi:F420-non-reducing hydrogenase iron-sulfur subunit